MHHVRKSNHRKMLKPKFYSSSSSDDDFDDAKPLKWKPIIASFPIESGVKPTTQNRSIESNPIIDSLNSKMSNNQTAKQQKLSAEVIQKEEIYNQAEVEANKKMFGCANPGRCLSKEEIQRRKDIILQIVNERLKSKLSELMGEFGERIEMNDTYDSGRSTDADNRYRNRSPDDDDIPEAPPPPTFNTSSESSDDDVELDLSITKEFELYEKEIKEKTLNTQPIPTNAVTTSTLNEASASSSAFSLSASYNPINTRPSNTIPNSQVQVQQQTSANYQQNWQQPNMQQWPLSDQSPDVAPWIPPVGPPQVMEPFPPPIESEQMCFMTPPPNFSTFPNTNPPANGWINSTPGWTNPPPNIFPSSYGSIPQYPNAARINTSQSTPYRPAAPQMHQAAPRMNWNARVHRPTGSYSRPKAPYNESAKVRPNAFLNPVRSQVYPSTNNLSVPIVGKSTYVNAILATEQKVATSTSETETKINAKDQGNDSLFGESWKKSNKDSNPQKRQCEQNTGNVNKNFNEISRPNRFDGSKAKKTRFNNPKPDDPKLNSRINDHGLEPSTNRKESVGVKTKPTAKSSSEIETRNDKTNANTFSTKFWGTTNANSDTSVDANSSRNDKEAVPSEWTRLCDIVDQLLDLPPNALKDIPLTDRRVRKRNEILMILSDDPGKFYAYVAEYGEKNVKWAVNMARRILFPEGCFDDSVAHKIAPFQRAIHVAIDTPKVSFPVKQEAMPKNTAKVPFPTKQPAKPKEWMKLCKIVDKLLDIPTRIVESLPPSDSRVRERNDILMILSTEPEDFLLQDEKYGAHNVDWAILAAKRILYPDGMCDERVRRIMLRQQRMLRNSSKSNGDRSISRDRESRKRSIHKTTTNANNDNRPRSVPKEWNQLCDIVDKVLDTPKAVRIKMSKRDPRWQQRENILLVLSDDPEKLASQSDELGRANVDWAIKSSKKIMFPNGTKDKAIHKKLSPQRRLLLRNRQDESPNDETTVKETKAPVNETSKQVESIHFEAQTDQRNNINGDMQNVSNKQSTKKEKPPVERLKVKTYQENEEKKTSESQKGKGDQVEANKSEIVVPAAIKELDENEVWVKLCNIVDKLLDLPLNAADKLEPSDKRLIERNDILMILSDDPENFSKFDASYGGPNVAWAIKSAKKLIYSDGKPNAKLADALWKQRDVIMCTEEGPKDASSTECNEWKCVRKIATKVFLLSNKGIRSAKKLPKEQLLQQIELLLQLSDEPDVVRSKPICKQIGEGRVEVAIAKCKHILNRMRKLDPKALLNFENLRSKMVLYSESLHQSKNIKNYEAILAEVRKIVDQKVFCQIYGPMTKWTDEQKLERNELAILLIKDPHFLASNEKYSDMVRKADKAPVAEIIADVEKCLLKCEYVKEKPAVICAPIIAKIKDVKYMIPFNERKLTLRIHRLIEQFLIAPKPEIFEIKFNDTDGTVDVVCANAMTFDWLKSSIRELDGLWSNAKLAITKAPITRKVLDVDDLKEIKMTLKTLPTESFAVIMKQLKKSNSKLNTEKWQSIPTNFSDPKKMFVMVDLESLVELERSKREIIVESGIIYFDIKYIGKENFEAKC